jgi:hypothetical protein
VQPPFFSNSLILFAALMKMHSGIVGRQSVSFSNAAAGYLCGATVMVAFVTSNLVNLQTELARTRQSFFMKYKKFHTSSLPGL